MEFTQIYVDKHVERTNLMIKKTKTMKTNYINRCLFKKFAIKFYNAQLHGLRGRVTKHKVFMTKLLAPTGALIVMMV